MSHASRPPESAPDPERELAQRLSAAAHAQGDVYGWFERLYSQSEGDTRLIPWADLVANPLLVEWAAQLPQSSSRPHALVVGCGLGDDAEFLAAGNWEVTAFDVAPKAVAWCRSRFSRSSVHYTVADLLSPPQAWEGRFDLIVEINTLQVLTAPLQAKAMANLARLLAPAGQLLVIARFRESTEPLGPLPWPLCREDFAPLDTLLRSQAFEVRVDEEDPPIRRARAVYERSTG